MPELDLLIRAHRAIIGSAEQAVDVGIIDGRIATITPMGANEGGNTPARQTIELGPDEVLLPGLVDTHVHINEPGRTQWEGFASATRAAAAGGVTTLIDMPLNSIPPTVDVASLERKRAVARDQVAVDVGFWGGAIPGNLADLEPLYDAGVFGFKSFLLHSGVDEFPPIHPDDLEELLATLRGFDAMLIVHAEDAQAIDRAPAPAGSSYADFLASRPRGAENLAIAWTIERARWTHARVHVLHLSSSDALPMIRTARADGVRVTVETCPHYLTLTAEQVPEGATQFKCCPPIREQANQDLLWTGLVAGDIDCIVTDHSPCTIDLKDLDTGDFGTAWGGVASLQIGLPVIWTQARERGHSLADVIGWMAAAPADLAGLQRKGRIAVGNDADLVVFAPDETFLVDPRELLHRNAITPYSGQRLTGVVRSTFLRGRPVDPDNPHGELLTRQDA